MRAQHIVDALGDGIQPRPNFAELGWVTPAFVAQEEAAFMGGRAGAYDLLTCSQNPFPRYYLSTPRVDGERGEVDVSFPPPYWPEYAFTYEFVTTGDGWQLDHVDCSPP